MEEKTIRQNPFCVISKEVFGEYEVRDIQTNSCWTTNLCGDNYAVVPDSIVQEILDTKGFCDIILNDEGTEITSFTARKIPNVPEPETPITELEQLRADVDYIAVMKGVDL